MNISIIVWLCIAIGLFAVDLILIAMLMTKRLKKKERQRNSLVGMRNIFQLMNGQELPKKFIFHGADYYAMQQVVLIEKKWQKNFEEKINIKKYEQLNIERLKSRNKIKRLRSIISLGYRKTEDARLALEKALLIESDYSVKLYIANALADIGNSSSIPVLVASLRGSHRFYRSKVNMLLADFGDCFNSYIPVIAQNMHFEMRELITDFASVYYSENTKNFLVSLLKNREEEMNKLSEFYHEGVKCCANCINHSLHQDQYHCQHYGRVEAVHYCHRYRVLPSSIRPQESYMKLVYTACDILAVYYPQVLDTEEFLSSDDITIKNEAIKALSNINMGEKLDKLITLLSDSTVARTTVNAISNIIERNPKLMYRVAEAFGKEQNKFVKEQLATVLSGRIEYYILKLNRQDKKEASEIIKEILQQGRTSEVIDFLNHNRDLDIENELLVIIREIIRQEEGLKQEFATYLNERILKKLDLPLHEEKVIPKKEKRNLKLKITLYLVLGFSFFFTPLLYLIRYHNIWQDRTFMEHVYQFVIDFNYYLAYYSMAINLIYIILLLLSYRHAQEQEELWKLKNMSFLFKKKMLPSVSIIAPAYNEEKTIIESANSLLNLKYPDYELIIVNDGSKDSTLETLIRYFHLKRVDYLFQYRLKTKQVRGVYMNRSLPKLIVVDKNNGGKADALNAGINISKKEYFCGIDADSLLEDEALLKLAALTLDEGIETPALGGNVLPINGCEIEQGQIKNIRIPDNKLGRLQTIEYIRAFMAGRMGWAKVNCLMIISGAFGLFRKERVISVGGYLTSSGKYEKDTVGEDMELVVRISRLMRELGLKYKIRYSYNANCWTEVPEQIKVLKKQRYRWHKGLIDILTFHAGMILNPRYGRTGLVAMPYFFIFEMFGPMLEFQGYVMVILAYLLGLLNTEMLILLFVCTILLGILISVASLVIAEKDLRSFSTKNLMTLIGYAFIENFGPRQFISFWRVAAFFQMLHKPGGWDKAERRGFAMRKAK